MSLLLSRLGALFFALVFAAPALADQGIKVALKSDTGNFLSRCNNCIPGGAKADSAFVHVKPAQLASSPWAHFNLAKIGKGVYTLRADTGKYLARCNGCVPGGTKPDSAMVHVTKAQIRTAKYAHWRIKRVGNRYTIQSVDSKKHLARCNGCVPRGAYPDSAMVHATKGEARSAGWAKWQIVFLP